MTKIIGTMSAEAMLAELRQLAQTDSRVEPPDSPWKPVMWYAEQFGLGREAARVLLMKGVEAGMYRRESRWYMTTMGARQCPHYMRVGLPKT